MRIGGIWMLAVVAACATPNGKNGAGPDGKPQGPTGSTVDPTAGTEEGHTDPETLSTGSFEGTATDLGAVTGMQDSFLGGHKRGRAMLAADFDRDGITDFFLGNPGDTSLVVRGVMDGGALTYEVVQVLREGHLSWAGAVADYDNDGDLDLFVAGGGNECDDLDILYRNMWVETGTLAFEDVTASAGVAGMTDETGEVVSSPSAGAVWGDVDRDGDVDLFVSGNNLTACGNLPGAQARNTLWLNDGEGAFIDGTEAVGLAAGRQSTRHSTLFDFDNDGDLDLYEGNLQGDNKLWVNALVETGVLGFRKAEQRSSGADDARLPWRTFATCAGDFDNDGWEDLMAFRRDDGDCSIELPSGEVLDDDGHALYRNEEGRGFRDIANAMGMNKWHQSGQRVTGVMGCQIGDLDNNGYLDVFVGNGGPWSGSPNQLFMTGIRNGELRFVNMSHLIEVPAPDDGLVGDAAPYPYRTHGSAMVDVDGDGDLELVITNGGPDFMPDAVREPNRLFDFQWANSAGQLTVELEGDGVHVSRDAIGTRVELSGLRSDGSEISIHRTLYGGSCFSAQNGFKLSFGLAEVDTIEELVVTWPDGTVTIEDGPTADSLMIRYP
jgi:hypothetical protein